MQIGVDAFVKPRWQILNFRLFKLSSELLNLSVIYYLAQQVRFFFGSFIFCLFIYYIDLSKQVVSEFLMMSAVQEWCPLAFPETLSLWAMVYKLCVQPCSLFLKTCGRTHGPGTQIDSLPKPRNH